MELRLAPAALALWAALLLPIPLSALLIILSLIWAIFYNRVQACILCAVWLLGLWRRSSLPTDLPRGRIHATLCATPRQTKGGHWFHELCFQGRRLPLLADSEWSIGDKIDAWVEPAGSFLRLKHLYGIAQQDTWPEKVRLLFRESVLHFGGGEGLIPGIVLGDTRLQSPQTQEIYALTGLAHLTAVSGSNVAIILSTVAIIFSRVHPRIRWVACALALILFIAIVGREASVLRAGAMGAVGLVATVAHRRADPLHALSLAIIGLLIYNPHLASHYGFILSVLATVGILILYPFFLIPYLPAIVGRALAVTLAAHVVTQPIIILMNGHISTVSVLCNLLAAPVIPCMTVLGMASCLLCLLPGNLEALPLFICRYLAAWVDGVAYFSHSRWGSSIELPAGFLGIWVGILASLWTHALFLYIHKRRAARRPPSLSSLAQEGRHDNTR